MLLIGACQPPSPSEPVLLVVSAPDEALLSRRTEVAQSLRTIAAGHLSLVASDVAERAMTAEGGGEKRDTNLVRARILVNRAEEKFRELDDEEALDLIAKATADLASVHQEKGAIPLLARAHFLAGAIYLARDRVGAAKNRLQRALDLDPEIAPERHKFAPRVLTELAALKSQQSVRPVGRLEVRLRNDGTRGEVYVDGQLRGRTPLVLDAVGEGRHLLMVKAPGFRSFVGSFSITGNRGHLERVNLVKDRELSQIVTLPKRLARGDDPSEVLSLLAQRAGVSRSVLAVLNLSSARTESGAPAIGVTIHVPGAGTGHAPAATPEALKAALLQALACESSGPTPARTAPDLLGAPLVSTSRPSPVPAPTPWYERPWFWGTAAFVTLAVAGGLVAARAANGPPEAVEITLIPRP